MPLWLVVGLLFLTTASGPGCFGLGFEARPSSSMIVVNKTSLPLIVYQDIGVGEHIESGEQKTTSWTNSNDQVERWVAAVDSKRNLVFCRVFTEAALRTGALRIEVVEGELGCVAPDWLLPH